MKTHVKITANWNELKARLKQKYPNLTDIELTFTPGKEDEFSTRLAKKLGKTEDEVNHVIDDLQAELKRGGTGRGGEGRGGAGRGKGETEY